jgi:hypothetical protein
MKLTTNTTCVGQWMLKLLHQLISLFPVFFDRVASSATSLYGFEKKKTTMTTTFDTSLQGSDPRVGPQSQDNDLLRLKLTELLRMEERAGGPPMAITVMFHHTITSMNGSFNLNFDRGFSSSAMLTSDGDDVVKAKPLSDSQSAILRWPAIFLRSTALLPSSPNSRMGIKKSIGRREQQLGSSTRIDDDTQSSNILSDSRSTWPYSSWAHLVSALKHGLTEPNSELPSDRIHWSQADKETSFLASPINHSMWLVLMIGAEDDNRWHRRRSSMITYEDMKGSFDALADELRMHDWFKPYQALEIRRSQMQSKAQQNLDLSTNNLTSDQAWDSDASTVDLIYSFKESFGLRPPRKKEPTKVLYGIRFGKGRDENISHREESDTINASYRRHALSVNAFFLGSELMHAIAID